jgi:hypothetical protein
VERWSNWKSTIKEEGRGQRTKRAEVKDAQIRKRLPRKKFWEALHNAEMQVLEAVIFEKRIMLKDCRDANTVSWMHDSNKETRWARWRTELEGVAETTVLANCRWSELSQTKTERATRLADAKELFNSGRQKKRYGAAAQRGSDSAGGGDLEKRIMLKDCRDANTVGWMRENRQKSRRSEKESDHGKWKRGENRKSTVGDGNCPNNGSTRQAGRNGNVFEQGKRLQTEEKLEPQHNTEMQVLGALSFGTEDVC